jgi:hypothetical protein
LWIIETGLSLLRHSAMRKPERPIEENEELAKLKSFSCAPQIHRPAGRLVELSGIADGQCSH